MDRKEKIMLLQFRFQNFKSFQDDTILDLTATKSTEFKNHVISLGNENILPTAAIYGANASGKSNVILAFRYMTMYVLNSLNYGGENSDNGERREMPRVTPFLLHSKSQQEVSSFEVYFVDPEEEGAKTYNYGFTVNSIGVQEEWLNYKMKSARKDSMRKVFYRNGETLELDGIDSASQDNLRVAIEKETLLVSLGARLKIQILKHIRDWFSLNQVVDFGRPEETFFRSRTVPSDFANDRLVQQNVVRYFSSFDPSIIDFNVETIKNEDETKSNLKIDAVHKMVDSDAVTTIPFANESAGTLKMFSLYPVLHKVLTKGSVLFVDELNGRLHPLLVRALIITFLDSETNPKHAQLIFTTHDAWQLNSGLLRRDEIWFAEKNMDGISTLYSLAEFADEEGDKIRKDENYEKNYLLGKYGGIPYMKPFDMFKE